MDDDKFNCITDAFFIKFKTEFFRIHKFIASLNPKLIKDVSKKNHFNIDDSLIRCTLICTLHAVLDYLEIFKS